LIVEKIRRNEAARALGGRVVGGVLLGGTWQFGKWQVSPSNSKSGWKKEFCGSLTHKFV